MKCADMMGAYCAELGLDQAKVEELLKMVSAAAMAEAPKLEEVSIEVEAKKEDEEAVKAEEEAPMSEVASLRAELLRVKRSAASEKVKSAIAGRKVSSATEALLTDALVAGKTATFDALLSDLAPVSAKTAAAAPRTVAPVAPGISHGNSLNLSDVMGNMTKWNDLSDAEQVRAISDLAEKEGVDPIDAWCWIRDGKAPTAVEEKKANLRFTQN
jgi:carboxylesterase type B